MSPPDTEYRTAVRRCVHAPSQHSTLCAAQTFCAPVRTTAVRRCVHDTTQHVTASMAQTFCALIRTTAVRRCVHTIVTTPHCKHGDNLLCTGQLHCGTPLHIANTLITFTSTFTLCSWNKWLGKHVERVVCCFYLLQPRVVGSVIGSLPLWLVWRQVPAILAVCLH